MEDHFRSVHGVVYDPSKTSPNIKKTTKETDDSSSSSTCESDSESPRGSSSSSSDGTQSESTSESGESSDESHGHRHTVRARRGWVLDSFKTKGKQRICQIVDPRTGSRCGRDYFKTTPLVHLGTHLITHHGMENPNLDTSTESSEEWTKADLKMNSPKTRKTSSTTKSPKMDESKNEKNEVGVVPTASKPMDGIELLSDAEFEFDMNEPIIEVSSRTPGLHILPLFFAIWKLNSLKNSPYSLKRSSQFFVLRVPARLSWH